MTPDSGPAGSSRVLQFEPLFPRRAAADDAHFDLTAMVDLVFMMNIFFLVTSITMALAEMDLPLARNCLPASEVDCVVVSLRQGSDPDSPLLWIGEGGEKSATSDPDQQADLIRLAAETAVREKNGKVLIKAEKNVRLKDTARVSSIVSSVEGSN